MDNLTLPGGLFWPVALAIGFPLLLIVSAEVLRRLNRAQKSHCHAGRGNPYRAAPCPGDADPDGEGGRDGSAGVCGAAVGALFWLIIVHALLSFLNALLFARRQRGILAVARARPVRRSPPRGAGAGLCRHRALDRLGPRLGQLVTALGVGSIVLGLALQEPLGNLFSGVMLMIERPLGVGDWLTVGGIEGVVVATNWRSVHLQTRNKDLFVVPNSVLAKQSFMNESRPAHLRPGTSHTEIFPRTRRTTSSEYFWIRRCVHRASCTAQTRKPN